MLPAHAPADERELISRIRAANLTYLSEPRLASLAASCRVVEERELPGHLIEAGCALGGSSILLATLKDPARPLRIHDVFAMIPAPGPDDTPDVHARYRTIVEGKSKGLGGETYYGYREDLLGFVRARFADFGLHPEERAVSFVRGLVQDTLVPDGAVALAHVDVDWYDPVRTCMERIFPRLVLGGSLIVDDYHDWGSCRKAVDEYLGRVQGSFELDDRAGSMRITKVRE